MIDPKGLKDTICSGKRLIIFLHDNPDPDALAAGWLLLEIAKSQGVKAKMVYGGHLGRAENRTMVRLLDIKLTHLQDQNLRYSKSDLYALIDTQPNSGNNSFPNHLTCHIVIDHHPLRDDFTPVFSDIDENGGCFSTRLLEYHQVFGLDLSPALATAAYYAIITETQDLEREATKADRDACLKLFPMIELTLLGKIRHPRREREYYRTIAQVMRRVMVGKNSCICHIGEVYTVEIVAEMADFLVAMNQVTWCLVSGFRNGEMTISIRTTHDNGKAYWVMEKLVADLGRGGGHDRMAGGNIPCGTIERYHKVAEQITQRFIEGLSRRQPERLRPLYE